MPHKVLQRTYSTRFNDFALEFYSFVADNYAPFYSRPIECTDRDAPFVLDGVLYHESDLNLEEHYTDTHGGAGRRPVLDVDGPLRSGRDTPTRRR